MAGKRPYCDQEGGGDVERTISILDVWTFTIQSAHTFYAKSVWSYTIHSVELAHTVEDQLNMIQFILLLGGVPIGNT